MVGRCAPSREGCAATRVVLGIVNRLIFWREQRFDACASKTFQLQPGGLMSMFVLSSGSSSTQVRYYGKTAVNHKK